jgi:hypothetical protein
MLRDIAALFVELNRCLRFDLLVKREVQVSVQCNRFSTVKVFAWNLVLLRHRGRLPLKSLRTGGTLAVLGEFRNERIRSTRVANAGTLSHQYRDSALILGNSFA